MDELKQKQKEIERSFKNELQILLRKYRAVIEVDKEMNIIDVECNTGPYDENKPYTYFDLPGYFDADDDL